MTIKRVRLPQGETGLFLAFLAFSTAYGRLAQRVLGKIETQESDIDFIEDDSLAELAKAGLGCLGFEEDDKAGRAAQIALIHDLFIEMRRGRRLA